MKISGMRVEKCLTKQVFMVNFCQQVLKPLSSYSRVLYYISVSRDALPRGIESNALISLFKPTQ